MMSRTAATMVALLMVCVAGMDEEVWGPNDSVKAFDAVEKAVEKVVASAAHSPEMLKRAKKVADDVKKDISEVESNSKLTKAQRNAKVGAAVKELMDLQGDFKALANPEGAQEKLNAKMDSLQKELAEKKKELAKDEAMIKLATLQKELAEKKLQLQKLIEEKNGKDATAKADAADAKEEAALVDKLAKASHDLKEGKKGEVPAPLKASLAEVESREKKVSTALAKLDADNKKTMKELDDTMKENVPMKAKNDALARGKSLLRALKAKEHRKFMKARAHKATELAELKDLEKSMKDGDVKKLQATLSKMQHEAKAFAAKSGNFLH